MAETAAQIIAAYNQGRDASRLALKYQAMRNNSFSFLRGTAHLFHNRLKVLGADPGGPAAWICGDLHLENFGTYLGGNGLTYFDVNDFDECALAPCTWDPLRLATSLLIAAPIYKVQRDGALTLAIQLIERYRAELAAGKPRWIERRMADGVIGDLIDTLRHRDPAKFVQKRTTGKRGDRLDTASEKMQPVTRAAERKLVKTFLTSLATGADGSCRYTFLDVAYRIAGTGSLGIRRYVVLAERKEGANARAKVLLDLKVSQKSSVAPVSTAAQPKWTSEGQRIVTMQTFAEAIPPGLLQAVDFGGESYVLKELQPTSDRLNLAAVAKNRPEFARTLSTMAALAAWAHLRCSGRRTSATADALMDFALDKSALKSALQAAKALEKATLDDWKDYCQAYDAGAFHIVLAAADKSRTEEAA